MLHFVASPVDEGVDEGVQLQPRVYLWKECFTTLHVLGSFWLHEPISVRSCWWFLGQEVCKHEETPWDHLKPMCNTDASAWVPEP